jgi:UDP-N-acetylmuramate dehydrogenase
VPGTIGGAVRMNAGAYGGDMAAVTFSATALDRSGHAHEIPLDALGFAYRRSALPEGWIVTDATLRGSAGAPTEIRARLAAIRTAREAAQPIRAKTGGSTFKNPPGEKAWELIDRSGCRGLTRGGAQVSEKHCNFLINTGGATAADLEDLGEEVRARVEAATGIVLDWEIKRIGERGA